MPANPSLSEMETEKLKRRRLALSTVFLNGEEEDGMGAGSPLVSLDAKATPKQVVEGLARLKNGHHLGAFLSRFEGCEALPVPPASTRKPKGCLKAVEGLMNDLRVIAAAHNVTVIAELEEIHGKAAVDRFSADRRQSDLQKVLACGVTAEDIAKQKDDAALGRLVEMILQVSYRLTEGADESDDEGADLDALLGGSWGDVGDADLDLSHGDAIPDAEEEDAAINNTFSDLAKNIADTMVWRDRMDMAVAQEADAAMRNARLVAEGKSAVDKLDRTRAALALLSASRIVAQPLTSKCAEDKISLMALKASVSAKRSVEGRLKALVGFHSEHLERMKKMERLRKDQPFLLAWVLLASVGFLVVLLIASVLSMDQLPVISS